MLSWLISQWLQQAAQEKIRQGVIDAASGGLTPKSIAENSDEPAGPPPCQIGLVMALDAESGGIVDIMEDRQTDPGPPWRCHAGRIAERDMVLVESGVGREAARLGARRLIESLRPAWVISAGFAGGLRSELRRGHILMADTLIDVSGARLNVGFSIDPKVVAATRGLHVGPLLTVDELVAKSDDKKKLAELHGAMAVDMESYAVAEVCRELQTRFLSVRVISDCVDDSLPPEVAVLLKQKTFAGQLGAAAGAIFNRVSSIGDMWQLKEDALKASDRLARFLRGVLPQLPVPEAPPSAPGR